jgi:adenine/guanine phosphoribosyltransferase-like PRPP-binding protein
MRTSHYSLSLSPAELGNAAYRMADEVISLLAAHEVPILIYRGMSGVAAATALSLALHARGRACGMIYVRKPNEYCHGREDYERALPALGMDKVPVMVFVDDFCSSGRTRRETIAVAQTVGDFSTEMITACLGDSRGDQGGIWGHSVEKGLELYSVGCF